jgi:hypothetical protein
MAKWRGIVANQWHDDACFAGLILKVCSSQQVSSW